MFDKIEQAHLCELHVRSDEETGLKALIAIHNTRLGPAIGGCRCIPYPDDDAAMEDAIRLAKGMSYKAALAGLPQGGGKSVLIQPKQFKNRHAYFERFGEFVDSLSGRYITSLDSGTSIEDMNDIAKSTHFVSGTQADGCNPSPVTALGVVEGIKRAVQFKLNRPDLENVHVAIQGVGHVGLEIAEQLFKLGAKLTVTDINQDALQHCQQHFNAAVVSPGEIFDVACDVFCPCGLGGVINDTTVHRLQCKIVAGSANNQLHFESHGQNLHEQGILYAPDFIINAGGLIHVSFRHNKQSDDDIVRKTLQLKETLTEVFTRSEEKGLPCNLIANQMAEQILYH